MDQNSHPKLAPEAVLHRQISKTMKARVAKIRNIGIPNVTKQDFIFPNSNDGASLLISILTEHLINTIPAARKVGAPILAAHALAAHVFVSCVSQRCLLTRQADMSG